METIEKLIEEFKPIYYQNPNLNSENFPIPDVIETEGAVIIKKDKYFSSEEALDEMKKRGLRPANIYETLIWAKDNQEKGQSVITFGSKWKDSDGYHWVPRVYAFTEGGFKFYLGYFGNNWYGGHCLLCFCDKESTQTLST
jgi:hypothetical protein